MVEPIFDFQFRLILIGDSTVGKSSLLKYFTDGKYAGDVSEPTVGVDFFARLVEIKPGVRVKLQLWDTAGQERFRSITKSYYRNSVGVIFVYDITNRQTFLNMDNWIAEAQQHIEQTNVIFHILGHKADADKSRGVTAEEGQQFAEFHGLKFHETSAVTGMNIEEAFSEISKDIYSKLKGQEFNMFEGWEGIKTGYSHGNDTLILEEAEIQGGCC